MFKILSFPKKIVLKSKNCMMIFIKKFSFFRVLASSSKSNVIFHDLKIYGFLLMLDF